MNATDILKEILRGGLSGGGGGGGAADIFKDIFGSPAQGQSRQQPQPRAGTTASGPEDISRQARELEDMLGVDDRPGSSPAQRPAGKPGVPSKSDWSQQPSRRIPPTLPPRDPQGSTTPERQDAEALVLIRSMIQAAKADGRLSPEEQEALLQRVGARSDDAVRFLQEELNRDVNVRDFAWSVPLGMEHKVYSISLTAIDLDSKAESDYLRELAHGLRLPAEVCDHIHRKLGVPSLPSSE